MTEAAAPEGHGVDDFPETTRLLEEEVAEGLFTRGAQVSVRADGDELLLIAVGDAGTGAPMAVDTIFRVYCTIKPVTALAVAALVERGDLDLEQPLDEVLPGVRVLEDGQVALHHVMSHTAGLHLPMAIEVEMRPEEKRTEFLRTVQRPPGWRVGIDAAYSEWYGWYLLRHVIERVTGEPIGRYLRDHVLTPLGMGDTWFGMTAEEHHELLPRIGVSHDIRDVQAFPLLLERGQRMCSEVNTAHGGYSTAGDLSRLYGGILDRLAGEGEDRLASGETLSTFTSSARPLTYDLVLGRECEYGLGFMTSLTGHAFGRSCSPSSFGHSGNVGSSFAFADPDDDLAVGVVFNGIVDAESAFLRRPALIRAIYTDLAALREGEADGDEGDADGGGEWDESDEAEEAEEGQGRGLFGRLRRRRG